MTGLGKGLEGREKGKSEVRHRELSRKPLIFLFAQLNGWDQFVAIGNIQKKRKKKIKN